MRKLTVVAFLSLDGVMDEYFLMVYPLVLGAGKKLFNDDGPKQELEVVKSVVDNGVLIARYKVKRS